MPARERERLHREQPVSSATFGSGDGPITGSLVAKQAGGSRLKRTNTCSAEESDVLQLPRRPPSTSTLTRGLIPRTKRKSKQSAAARCERLKLTAVRAGATRRCDKRPSADSVRRLTNDFHQMMLNRPQKFLNGKVFRSRDVAAGLFWFFLEGGDRVRLNVMHHTRPGEYYIVMRLMSNIHLHRGEEEYHSFKFDNNV